MPTKRFFYVYHKYSLPYCKRIKTYIKLIIFFSCILLARDYYEFQTLLTWAPLIVATQKYESL